MNLSSRSLVHAGVCQEFEKQLKQLNPHMPSLTYNINDLYTFIDSVPDLSCLVYEANVGGYMPYDKSWIKKKVYMLLKRQAS